ncbi:hypothetical protein EV126DRAFT_425486 [Verticillium dahliae]|nr:hypothetical protein EV126DRAFT_425486 [Verticillium dahliae]
MYDDKGDVSRKSAPFSASSIAESRISSRCSCGCPTEDLTGDVLVPAVFLCRDHVVLLEDQRCHLHVN